MRLDAERVVAGMATMPSREATFSTSFLSIVRQVERLYLYLDGHEAVPEIARNHPRVVPVFARDYPKLHANGKLIGLVLEDEPCLYTCLDDDIYYLRNYVWELRQALKRHDDQAVVGLHGAILGRGSKDWHDGCSAHGSYATTLPEDITVDMLGTGAVLFQSSVVSPKVLEWPKVSMTDMGVAQAAARAKVPMISIRRAKRLAFDLARGQADSLSKARQKDRTHQIKLGQELIGLLDHPLSDATP
ncbi:hypothetical protein [Halovulum sp. GXIMD14793]